MTLANCRVKAIALVAASMFATYAIAESQSGNASSNTSNNGQQTGQQAQSSSEKSSENKQQNQASQNRADENASQNQGSQREKDTHSNRDADRDSRDSKNESARSSSRDDQESRNAQSDNRADNRDRSNQYDNRDRQPGDRDTERSRLRSSDDRSRDRDRDYSRQDEGRRDMRGPDMGLWFNRSSRDGLVISDVSNRGPIAKLGFHEGDRIVSVNGRRVNSESEFIQLVFHSNVNRVPVVISRDGREETIYIEPAVFVDNYDTVEVDPLERFGIILDDRYDDRIVVWRVIPRSPAYYAGFRPGDVIASFSGHPYRTRGDFERSVGTWKQGETNVQVRRGDRNRQLTVDVPSMDRSERSARRTGRVEQRQSDRVQRDSNDGNERNENYQDNRPDNRQDNRRGILNGGVLRGRSNR